LPDQIALVALGLFVLLGLAAPIAVRLAYEEMASFWSARLRFSPAALIYWLLVLPRGVRLSRGRALLGAIILGR